MSNSTTTLWYPEIGVAGSGPSLDWRRARLSFHYSGFLGVLEPRTGLLLSFSFGSCEFSSTFRFSRGLQSSRLTIWVNIHFTNLYLWPPKSIMLGITMTDWKIDGQLVLWSTHPFTCNPNISVKLPNWIVKLGHTLSSHSAPNTHHEAHAFIWITFLNCW